MKNKNQEFKEYIVTNIKYDFGTEWNGFSKPDLPKKLVIEVPSEMPIELDDYLANEISERTGFCVEHFEYEHTPERKPKN